MRIGVLVNDVETESSGYTTIALARAARRRGHEVFVFGVSDFVYESGHVCAWARQAPEAMDSAEAFLQTLRAGTNGQRRRPVRVTVDDLDVLLLRNNPADDLSARPWAAHIGLMFGEQAQHRGVLVLNDPQGLSRAMSKLYLERFPAAMRPASVVSRHVEDVRSFLEQHERAVVKPLTGSGGKNVFVVRRGDEDNFNQIVEAVTEHGYLIVQEYLPQAREGDVRMMLVNGRPLTDGRATAALRRVAAGGDLRNNVKAGGRVEPVEVTETMLRLAELARPQLVADGMFLVGLDIVGDKVMEVNVFTPGGLVGTSALYGVDFAARVVERLEEKTVHSERGAFDNRLLACL